MKKKQGRKYLDQHWKKMQRHFKTFVRQQDMEALHGFRVQVKKIRSLLTLLGQNDKNAPLLKDFRPIRKLFKAAGGVRDADLYKQQAKAAGIHWEPLATGPNQPLQPALDKLVSKGEKHLKKMKAVKQQLKQQLHSLTTDQVNTFYEKQLQLTQQLLEQHTFSEDLHDARKMLKHLLYNKAILQKKKHSDLAIHFEYIDELQGLIGDWHDSKLALHFFTPRLAEADLRILQEKQEALEKAITEKGADFQVKVQGNRTFNE